jgi:predicted alpha/beta hydrolase family esterase
MPIEKARNLAQRWNSAFVNLGDAGHIDASAGFGPWPLARHAIETFARQVSTDDRRVSVAEVSQKR